MQTGWKLGSTSRRPLAGIVHRHWAEFCDLKDGEVLISELTTINSFRCHTKIHKNITVERHTFRNVSDNDLKYRKCSN